MYLQNPFLFLTFLTKFSFMYTLTFMILSLHIYMASLYSFQALHPFFHDIYMSLISHSLTGKSLFNHASFLPPLLVFLCWGTDINVFFLKDA